MTSAIPSSRFNPAMSFGKRDESGHFQVGFARNAVALEHEADVSAAEHFRYTDISGIASGIRRTVARRADHEIGRSGYSSPYYFSTAFRKKYGAAPREYRKSAKSSEKT